MTVVGGLAAMLVLGSLGLLGWRALAPGLRRLQPGDTSPDGFLLWVIGFVAFHLAGLAAALLFVDAGAAGDAGAAPPDLPLSRTMPLQGLSSLLAVGITLLVAARRRIGLESLGLRPQRGPSPLAVAVCAWLAFHPLFLLVAQGNAELQALFGNELDMQQHLADFLADDQARRSPLIWATMVLVIPACEEFLFRGALHGGLRRWLNPTAAVVASSLIFAVAHGNPGTVLLPVTALGVALALLYERTASLSAPILFHALHNGLTLAVASFFPEAQTP